MLSLWSKGHDKEKCYELIGWPEWAGSGGRSGYGGGRGGSRGGRQGVRGRGTVAAALNNIRQSFSNNSSEIDRSSLSTLSDEQVHQLIAALKTSSSMSSTSGSQGPELEELD